MESKDIPIKFSQLLETRWVCVWVCGWEGRWTSVSVYLCSVLEKVELADFCGARERLADVLRLDHKSQRELPSVIF